MPSDRTRPVRGAALILSLALGATAASAAAPERYDAHRVVRVTVPDDAALKHVLELTDDVWSHRVGLGRMDVRVDPEQFARLIRLGLPVEVLIDDVQQLIDAERAAPRDAAWFTSYKDYDGIKAYVDSLVALRPDLATRYTVGTSLQGREIFGIRIGKPPAVGAPAKPAFAFNGCQHAREWIAAVTPVYIADALLTRYDTDPAIKRLVDEIDFYIVPIANPDGYVFSWTTTRLWRKNRAVNAGGSFGVDLNRNWGYQWGGPGASPTPTDETYRGPSAFSEPESRALRDHLMAIPNLQTHIDFHSYSQLILSPWAYTLNAAPDAAQINLLADEIAAAFTGVYNNFYEPGPTAQILYEAAGSVSDWVYGSLDRFAWGVELRDTGVNGFVLPPAQIVPTGEEALAGVRALAERILAPIALLARVVPEYAAPATPTPVALALDPLFGLAIDAPASRIFWRAGSSGPFSELAVTQTSPGVYSATLPAAPCGQTIEYYGRFATNSAVLQSFPSDAPTASYKLDVADVNLLVDDAFETNLGWTVGATGDTATSGVWVRANPVGTANQPEDDHTPGAGVACWVTANGTAGGSVGAADVDGGATTLISPAYDCSAPGDWRVEYWRWYSDTETSTDLDAMTVSISNNNGASWTQLERQGANLPVWTQRSFRVADFVPPTAAVRLRFVVNDTNPGHVVEGAVDDLRVLALSCAAATTPGDLDADGDVDASDLASLLGSWGPCPALPTPCPADLDGDGQVGASDLAALLGSWG